MKPNKEFKEGDDLSEASTEVSEIDEKLQEKLKEVEEMYAEYKENTRKRVLELED